MFEPTVVFRKCTDTRYRRLADDGVVVKQTAGEVLVLNEVGVRVLELLETALPVSSLLEDLAKEYTVDRITLEQDVQTYLQELLAAQVIEQVVA